VHHSHIHAIGTDAFGLMIFASAPPAVLIAAMLLLSTDSATGCRLMRLPFSEPLYDVRRPNCCCGERRLCSHDCRER
jgi:hypothetical protein